MITITGGLIETEQGHIWWDFESDEGGYVELYNLFVKPEFRGHGYARALITSAMILIKQQYAGMKIKITPDPREPGIDASRLASFYASMGLIVHYPNTIS